MLCSGLLHDSDENLPRRAEILASIQSALNQLEGIATESKSARTSASVLRYLISKLPSLDLLGDGARQQRYSTPLSILAKQNAAKGDVDIHQERMPANAIFGWENDPVLFTNILGFDLSNSSDLDLGGIENIWTWDALNISDLDFRSIENI